MLSFVYSFDSECIAVFLANAGVGNRMGAIALLSAGHELMESSYDTLMQKTPSYELQEGEYGKGISERASTRSQPQFWLSGLPVIPRSKTSLRAQWECCPGTQATR